MSRIEELRAKRNSLQIRSDETFAEAEKIRQESLRVADVAHNASSIIKNLDDEFASQTKLRGKDIGFLFFATALQCVRQYFITDFKERLGDQEAADKTFGKDKFDPHDLKARKEAGFEIRHHKLYKPTKKEIILHPVPFDTTRGSKQFEDLNPFPGTGKLGHRAGAIGHDPILGWIFGVANIISDTITICPEYELGEKKIRIPYVESYNVDMGSNFCWKEQTPTWNIFKNSFESIGEDKHRLYAALFAQGLHLASDEYTKLGLPVPFLSLIDSDKAYDIYKDGYDYLDYLYDTQILRRTLKSAAQSIMINMIIGAIHKFFYNPNTDFDKELDNVRTRKIIQYSNMIATTSDVAQTAIRAYAGDENAIKNFDLGGFLVTVYRLITDTKYIQKIKEEFIFNEWDRIVESKNNIFNI